MTTLVFMFSIFSGRYFDAHGTRTLLIGGSVVFIGALVGIACECTLARLGPRLTPVSTKYWHLMLSHAAVGLSASSLYSPATAVSGHWFMRKRSTAVGIVVCGSGLAGVIYPIMIKRLIEQLSESSSTDLSPAC